MKILNYSDLHLEFENDFKVPKNHGADLVVLSGDINLGTRGIEWAKDTFKCPVLYVLGNHEFYNYEFPTLYQDAINKAMNSNVHILQNEAITIEGIRFLGTTLWTDMAIKGDKVFNMIRLREAMNDYHLIHIKPSKGGFSGYSKPIKLSPAGTVQAFNNNVAFLKKELRNKTIPTVVITHHCPTIECDDYVRYSGENAPAYCSNLENLMQPNIKYWLCGHTHISKQIQFGETKVVMNSRGYQHELAQGFNPKLILEL